MATSYRYTQVKGESKETVTLKRVQALMALAEHPGYGHARTIGHRRKPPARRQGLGRLVGHLQSGGQHQQRFMLV